MTMLASVHAVAAGLYAAVLFDLARRACQRCLSLIDSCQRSVHYYSLLVLMYSSRRCAVNLGCWWAMFAVEQRFTSGFVMR